MLTSYLERNNVQVLSVDDKDVKRILSKWLYFISIMPTESNFEAGSFIVCFGFFFTLFFVPSYKRRGKKSFPIAFES